MTIHREFFDTLRASREAKGITLEHISRETLIDIKYLSAIEQGNIEILPATYVRAFIREYASTIGLDPAAVMIDYGRLTQPEAHALHTDATGTVLAPPSPPPASGPQPPWWTTRVARISAGGFGIVCTIVLIIYLAASSRSPGVREIPFATTVRENELRLLPRDSTKTTPGAPAVAPGDSLVLYATSIDSVWMELAIDGTPPNDYLFAPGIRRHWKAKDRFTVTLGNGGGILFRLNATDIGTLGKRGSVVRNFELNRRSSPATLKGSTP
jgi:hypothetical protein